MARRTPPAQNNLHRSGVVHLVPLAKMHVSSRHAQREKYSEARVDYIHARFDPDKLGHPVVSKRNGEFYIVDGQHRIEATKRFLGDDWPTQSIECCVYEGLSESDEAELFLSLNDVLSVNSFDKFRVAVNAGRPDEVDINRIVQAANLTISRDMVPGGIRAVTTLRRVYARADGQTLARVLEIIRDAYGDAGFEARVIDGLGHLCQRYNGVLDPASAVAALSNARGGVNGLLGKADVLHKQTGQGKAICVAAAAVEIINSKGRRLPSWWKAEEEVPAVAAKRAPRKAAAERVAHAT